MTRRIALYSHDTMGLGHMRRNLLIAQTLARRAPDTTILLIAGALEASVFGSLAGIDCLTLPALAKSADAKYRARSLVLPLREIVALRSRTIRAALDAFAPDLLIVDNVPCGAEGELRPALESLRRRGSTRCVLGLRDVLDDPVAVKTQWRRAGNDDVIGRYYDGVWIYGDRTVYETHREYDFAPAITKKLHYTGYIDQRPRLASAQACMTERARAYEPYVLCTVGGGQDGHDLARAFCDAAAPPGVRRVVVTGPYMREEVRRDLSRSAAARRDLEVLEFVAEPTPLLARAACIVGMGGYNTICEVLSFRKRAIIVPRVTPRREQFIRADRLCRLGVLDMIHPGTLDPAVLGGQILETLSRPEPRPHIDLHGLDCVTALVEALANHRADHVVH